MASGTALVSTYQIDTLFQNGIKALLQAFLVDILVQFYKSF
jgi:hypothetical protein